MNTEVNVDATLESAVAAETPKKANPLIAKLKKKLPGELFRLPSRGLFYRDGEIDPEVENGEIVIYPMTTIDELVMRSPDMLFNGSAITEVIARCCPQVHKPERLIASDVDFILTAMRKVSYGPMMPMKHKCSKCEAPEHEFQVSIVHFIEKSKEISQEQFDAMSIILDDYNIKLRPCVFEEMIKILQRSDGDFDTPAKVADWIDDSLLAIVRSVDSINDRAMIREWLQHLPRSTKERLLNSVEGVNQWGLEFEFESECPKCSHKDDIRTSLNPTSFFMQPSSPETP